MLRKIAAATSLAVSVARAKERLRIDTSDSDSDNDIERLLLAAQDTLEGQTGLILQPSTWEYRQDSWGLYGFWNGAWTCWGLCGTLSVPAAPIREITGVTYFDENEVEQTVAPANYTWERTPEGAEVTFIRDYLFPTLGYGPDRVRVQFTAGFDDQQSGSGDDPELKLPPRAEMAILFLVGAWSENRESSSKDQIYKVPDTFELLAQQLRVFR